MTAPSKIAALPLEGADTWEAMILSDLDGALALKARQQPFERYLVAVNVVEANQEWLRPLTPYFATCKAAEAARLELLREHPTAAILPVTSLIDLAAVGHTEAAGQWLRREFGIHGEGIS